MAWANLPSGETHTDEHAVMCKDEVLGWGVSCGPAATSQWTFDITAAMNIGKRQQKIFERAQK